MAIASNSKSKLGLVVETALGSNPLTALTVQPFSSFSLNPTTAELTDTRKTGSREMSAVVTGNRTFAGTMTGPLSYGNYDSLLESAMFSAWTANVLKVGETLKSFTMELGQADISQYMNYGGVVCNGFTIDSTAEGLTNVSFDLLALDGAITDVGAPYSVAPVVVNDAFKTCNGSIQEGGVDIAYVNAVNLTLTNNMTPLNFWGTCASSDYNVGMADITGTLSLFFQDEVVLNKYLSGEYSSLQFTLSDAAGNQLKFFLPRIKYSGATLDVAEGNDNRLIELPFRAVKNVTEGSGLVITRIPA